MWLIGLGCRPMILIVFIIIKKSAIIGDCPATNFYPLTPTWVVTNVDGTLHKASLISAKER
jgi:hypothetical protein